MKPPSIRFKLTAWYFGVLIATLGIFGFAAFFAMQEGIRTTVDQGLRSQARGIEELISRVTSQQESEELSHELREHSEIRTEADFSQVSDQQGRWIYRTPLMIRYDVPLPVPRGSSIYELKANNGLPLRVLISEATFNHNSYVIQVASPMNGFYGALNRFRWLTLVLSPFLITLASAGGYWISRRALMPVDEIIRAAKNIDSKNLARRLKVSRSGDELERLSETLNGMLERLEAAFKRITQFTADASHELRTPLALMRTTMEVSLRTSHSESEYREAQVQTVEELEKTSLLVEKLMLLARADAGVETLDRRPLDLVDVLREVFDQGRILALGKNITVKEAIGTAPVMIDGDSDALRRLFLILIDNAIKYALPNKLVVISLSMLNNTAVVEVRDTGIGIAPADLSHIFERFYRADKARSREAGGVGLGLSIARWEAEAHGGAIDVQSTVGKGSVFRVRLPVVEN